MTGYQVVHMPTLIAGVSRPGQLCEKCSPGYDAACVAAAEVYERAFNQRRHEAVPGDFRKKLAIMTKAMERAVRFRDRYWQRGIRKAHLKTDAEQT